MNDKKKERERIIYTERRNDKERESLKMDLGIRSFCNLSISR